MIRLYDQRPQKITNGILIILKNIENPERCEYCLSINGMKRCGARQYDEWVTALS